MLVGIPKETGSGERRVAITPAHVTSLVALGVDVMVETQAGVRAGFDDSTYESQGARVAPSMAAVFQADVMLQVRVPGSPGFPSISCGLVRRSSGLPTR